MKLVLMKILEMEWVTQSDKQSSGRRMDALSTCLDQIPEKSKSLLKLRYFEGYNGIEIAEKIGIELNAVYKRLSRLHHGLRICIEKKTPTAPHGHQNCTTVTDSTMVPLRNFLGPEGMLRQVLYQQEGKEHSICGLHGKNSQKHTSRYDMQCPGRFAFTQDVHTICKPCRSRWVGRQGQTMVSWARHVIFFGCKKRIRQTSTHEQNIISVHGNLVAHGQMYCKHDGTVCGGHACFASTGKLASHVFGQRFKKEHIFDSASKQLTSSPHVSL